MISLRSRKRLDADPQTRIERVCGLLEDHKATLKRAEDQAAIDAFAKVCYSLGDGRHEQEWLLLWGFETEAILKMLEDIARFARLAGNTRVATPEAIWRYVIDHRELSK